MDAEFEEFRRFKEWQQQQAATAPPKRVRVKTVQTRKVHTFRELVAIWSEYAPGTYKSWPNRQYHRKALLNTLVTHNGKEVPMGDIPWNEMHKGTCALYRMARLSQGVQGNSVNNELTTAQMMFSYFVNEPDESRRLCTYDPIAGWKRDDIRKYRRRTRMSWAELREWLSHGHPMFQDMVWFAARCVGMRNTEFRTLEKVELAKDGTKRLHLHGWRNKNGEPRTVPVPDDAWEIVQRYAKASRGPYVFTSPSDPKRVKPVPQGTFWSWLDKCRKRAGKTGVGGERLVVHHARHAGLNEALTAGANPIHVSAAGGLSLGQLEETYLHFNAADQERMLSQLNSIILPDDEPTSGDK